ncbi:transcription/translation regulatory transformer protein RfaH [Marinobacterium marinum]|uniref:Transcription/translation regulatory transformer protein RfaH n=1 Tax=Marinobacterium marinum TaxID=2756129 RepID=A0A7W2AAQ7_9GAMM|nr:transcription/translation regulatory transformer protein RfaH [Marinobacterium marinum]MBA4501285.1 transcription/translation regulatory transformer protein RfaH [Marinobacterium marinum]
MSDYKWYVVQSKPGQTDKAAQELCNQGFEVFLPLVRTVKLQRGKRIELTEPLFAGYLFIELSELSSNWRPIRSTRGVARIISFGNQPAVVPDGVIEQLRDNLRHQAELQAMEPNQTVRITEGPFANLNAVFTEFDGEKRAFLMLELLGQWQRLSLPLSALKKAD